MFKDLAKDFVLRCISQGFILPQLQIDRINEMSYLKMLISQLNIDCVLDVGANKGQFASELRKIGYSGFIVSFEPVSTEFAAMKNQFNGDLKWKGFQMALGSKDESGSIMIPNLSVMSSLLEPIGPEKNLREETVQVRRLDGLLPSLIEDYGVSNIFLKMDTQGYDLEVFKGAEGCLEKVLGIQSEISIQPLYKNMPHYIEALDRYEKAGFSLYNLSVVSRIENGGLLEMNCFMRR